MSTTVLLSTSSRPRSRDLLAGLSRLCGALSHAAEPSLAFLHPAYHDVTIVCSDGEVRWNRFLLAANSALLCSCLDLDHRDGTDSDAPSVVLLPGVSSATVGTMLRCTLDLAVRRDVLSVNEQHVMRLLGFRIPNDGGKEDGVQQVQEEEKCLSPVPGTSNSAAEKLKEASLPLEIMAEEELLSTTSSEEEEDKDRAEGGPRWSQAPDGGEEGSVAQKAQEKGVVEGQDRGGAGLSLQCALEDAVETSSSVFSDIPISRTDLRDDLDELSVISIGEARSAASAPSDVDSPDSPGAGDLQQRGDPAPIDVDKDGDLSEDSSSRSKATGEPSSGTTDTEGISKRRREREQSSDKSSPGKAGVRGRHGCPHLGCAGISFPSRSHLEVHLAGHDGDQEHPCRLCGRVFPHPARLKAHMLYHKDREQEALCPHCNKSFKGTRVLGNHVRMYHDKIDCALCKEAVVRKDIRRHFRRWHPGEKFRPSEGEDGRQKRFLCHVCRRGFSTANALGAHKTARHPELRRAGVTTSEGEGDRHPRCDPCGKTFGSAAHLAIHRRERHSDKDACGEDDGDDDHVGPGEECGVCKKVVRDLRYVYSPVYRASRRGG